MFARKVSGTSANRRSASLSNNSSYVVSARDEYSLADTTYDELLDKLADRRFADVPDTLRANIVAYYGAGDPPAGASPDQRKRSIKIQLNVTQLNAGCSCL